MKRKLLLLSFLLSITVLSSYSQINLNNLANKGLESVKQKKNLKLAETYTTYFTANGESIPMMRVPSAEITSDASSYIVLLQTDLQTANESYATKGAITNLNTFSSNLSNIISYDGDWVVEHYKTEIDFYQKYEAKRKKTADSLDVINKKNEQIAAKRIADSLAVIKKAKDIEMKEIQKVKADSMAYVERTKGFSFVNVDELSLRETASKTGKLLATLGACTYVKIINDVEVDGYVKVKVGNMQGFVYKSYLVDNLDSISVEGADIVTAKSKPTVVIETVTNTNTRTYSRDSNGNCYYLNSTGKRIFVDRSHCN